MPCVARLMTHRATAISIFVCLRMVQLMAVLIFFFFKQKTAYEITVCWSSDVCSSDLGTRVTTRLDICFALKCTDCLSHPSKYGLSNNAVPTVAHTASKARRILIQTPMECAKFQRSEERRVGKECMYRW